MDVVGEYTFDAPQNIVWEALRDPDVLNLIFPDAEDFKEIDKNTYQGRLKFKVGPILGKYKGEIQLSNIVTPVSYSIEVNGEGPPGSIKGSWDIKLKPMGDQTYMVYSGTAQVRGRIARVGQRLLDASVKSFISQSLNELNKHLRQQVAQQNTQAEPEPRKLARKLTMQRWEYYTTIIEANAKEVDLSTEAMVPDENHPVYSVYATMPELNRLGEKGWELVSMKPVIIGRKHDVMVHPNSMQNWSNTYFCVFKRPA